jgi:uncharacterized protein YdhG (YjbR/CyaY superfamily)
MTSRPGRGRQPMAKRGLRRPKDARIGKPATVEEYLAALSPAMRTALEGLRKTVRSVVPDAEECISYGIPGFRYKGRMLAWFAAAARHCSFFPGAVVNDFEDELAGYDTSKGTVRFAPGEPLPATLVRKLLEARIARMAAPRLAARGKARRRARLTTP